MTTVRRESLAEQAAELLLARIGAGEWTIGGKLPGETTLAPQLGVGRSTAREAIRILAGRGVLATRQGAGVFVTAVEPIPTWDAVLDRADIIAVLEARTAIEVEAAVLAAERRTPADLDELRRTLAERDRRRTDIRAHVEADMAFHRAVVVASGNPVLRELFDGFAPRSLQAMIDMLRIRGHHGDAADQDAHARIGDAIAARDPRTAGALTREHLDTVKRLFG
ncbi:FadR family transcriptional regulator [Microbacterium sp. p3-SID338]|uniref:FadR/GntR family transcriptional regulator n=1 Tax=unclassified Microbacterium TaxID=2609290 RepID=UPI000C8042C4|nr:MULTISPECIES: FadR/GntR family transcriptional regulator [unclassified Microbacterium]MCT1396202.1 FadR family transcriptional regulator [Microbacterium sp. p3-SID338]PMC06606.1 GntR family transcriptional regulator [Microbacterium sp. UMB0228]